MTNNIDTKDNSHSPPPFVLNLTIKIISNIFHNKSIGQTIADSNEFDDYPDNHYKSQQVATDFSTNTIDSIKGPSILVLNSLQSRPTPLSAPPCMSIMVIVDVVTANYSIQHIYIYIFIYIVYMCVYCIHDLYAVSTC